MAYQGQAAPERIDSYILKEVIIESDRLPVKFAIENITTDLDLYEHIDKPYITGSIIFNDSQGIFTGLDFLGGERVTIKISSTRKDAKLFKKVFYVTSVMNAVKINDQNEAIGLNLIEDIGYFANLINVNKSYSGSCHRIIEKISNTFLQKEVNKNGVDFQKDFNVIIPNLNPIEAISWIKNKATDQNGYPFFLYSTLIGDSITFSSLTHMLRQRSMNPKKAFTYWQSSSTSRDETRQRRTIMSYTYADTENMFSLIRDGVVGANYSYLDTFTGNHTNFKFDVIKDSLDPFKNNKVDFSNTQFLPVDEKLLTLNKVSINKVQSRTITQIGSSGAYNTGNPGVQGSYSEETNESSYKKKIIARSMHKMLTKSPLNIVVNGYDFIDGNHNTTIGNKLKVEFMNSTVHSQSEDRKDPKRSGDYLIYATRHMFKKERYDLALGCVKIGNNK